MPLFSQRAGLKPATKAIQRASIDVETRNALWSILWKLYERCYKEEAQYGRGLVQPYRDTLETLGTRYWTGYFRNALDTERSYSDTIQSCRAHFFSAKWNEVLDFLEYTIENLPEGYARIITDELNEVLSRESCAYRFVGGIITEVTSEAEIAVLDSAIESSTKEVSAHLRKSLQLASDRKVPDFHNSIKESVSAIEAAVRQVTGSDSATLSSALKKISSKEELHPALIDMLSKLYGYAGDEGGVRHANKERGYPVSRAEAMLILSISSATCGFLASKQQSK